MNVALEIAVTSPTGAVVARDGGADRVELCSALELDGLTPSDALVRATVDTGIDVNVLVRCRPGAFVHDADEVALMTAEVRSVVRGGAAGVVVGALTPHGTLDVAALRRFVDAARAERPDVEVTLHRCIDRSADPVTAVAALADLGFTRVLTSGGAPAAPDGLDTLAAMVRAAGPVTVMAGGGVTPEAIPALVATNVGAVHLSAKRLSALPGDASSPTGRATDSWFVTDPTTVRAARAAVDERNRAR